MRGQTIIIPYNAWLLDYIPINNKYFSKAPFNGKLFHQQELQFIGGFVKERKLWSLVRKNNKVVIIPGLNTGAEPDIRLLGYFACEKRLTINSNNIEVPISDEDWE